MNKNIQLDDLLANVTPYSPQVMKPSQIPVFDLPKDLHRATANTARDILKRNGMHTIEVTDDDAQDAQDIFENLTVNAQLPSPDKLVRPEVIMQLDAFLSEYDWRVVNHADQIRQVVTNKLLQLSSNRDPRIVLKAVELLGKLADVGMFVDKQEVTLKHTSDEDLKQLLATKLGLLIDSTAEPSTPTTIDFTMADLP